MSFWHARYLEQAEWTEALRSRLLQQAGRFPGPRLLEVGVGTGVVLTDVAMRSGATPFGADIDLDACRFAKETSPALHLSAADGLSLPYASATFGAAFCHFLLLWVPEPLRILHEMRRVLLPGGWVGCLAEPDYGGRIDHPASLAEVGRLQTQALAAQGADPQLGRQLRSLLHQAGFEEVHAGILGGQWNAGDMTAPNGYEWPTLRADLAGRLSEAELARLEAVDREAWAAGSRILYVPTFYAHGRVPQ